LVSLIRGQAIVKDGLDDFARLIVSLIVDQRLHSLGQQGALDDHGSEKTHGRTNNHPHTGARDLGADLHKLAPQFKWRGSDSPSKWASCRK
jgi:hypothetical protein